MTASWKRSREAKLWHWLRPAQAIRVLSHCYGEGASAEALLRAFLAERDRDPAAARFWVGVYEALSESRAGPQGIVN